MKKNSKKTSKSNSREKKTLGGELRGPFLEIRPEFRCFAWQNRRNRPFFFGGGTRLGSHPYLFEYEFPPRGELHRKIHCLRRPPPPVSTRFGRRNPGFGLRKNPEIEVSGPLRKPSISDPPKVPETQNLYPQTRFPSTSLEILVSSSWEL